MVIGSNQVKVMYLWVSFGGSGHSSDQIIYAPRVKHYITFYAAELCTLSVMIHIGFGAQLLLSPRVIRLRSAQLNLQTCILIQRRCLFCTINHTQAYIPTLVFTSCHDRRSNLQPSDERAGMHFNQLLVKIR